MSGSEICPFLFQGAFSFSQTVLTFIEQRNLSLGLRCVGECDDDEARIGTPEKRREESFLRRRGPIAVAS